MYITGITKYSLFPNSIPKTKKYPRKLLKPHPIKIEHFTINMQHDFIESLGSDPTSILKKLPDCMLFYSDSKKIFRSGN